MILLVKKKGIVQNLIYNYQSEEKSIVSQLYFKATHDLTIGTYREQIWQSLFESIVPKKFVVEQSVFIIDSSGEISSEVDLVILDEMYTPYIFKKGQLKFIPIEAVAVVIQCKSVSKPSCKSLKSWVDSIKKLKTVNSGIARMANGIPQGGIPGQKATRPILIYCHLGNNQDKNESFFDITLQANEEQEKFNVKVNEKFKTLNQIYEALNFHECVEEVSGKLNKDIELEGYRVKQPKGEVSLLSLNFILNQALMLLNNPMLFPHQAYVEMFNTKGE